MYTNILCYFVNLDDQFIKFTIILYFSIAVVEWEFFRSTYFVTYFPYFRNVAKTIQYTVCTVHSRKFIS